MKAANLIFPDWPAPPGVGAVSTTRLGGVSTGPWESFNLGDACGDEPRHVQANRDTLGSRLPAKPAWMRQVHGARVMEGGQPGAEADAVVTAEVDDVLAILTADCLPVLLCNAQGTRVGAAHAGWRGLAGGVIEATVSAMNTEPEGLMAWLGPAISGAVYEVGDDVRDAFAGSRGLARNTVGAAFKPHGERWLLDVYQSARGILAGLGITRVYGGNFCTFGDAARFFSHRRDGVTGRMASLIWLEEAV